MKGCLRLKPHDRNTAVGQVEKGMNENGMHDIILYLKIAELRFVCAKLQHNIKRSYKMPKELSKYGYTALDEIEDDMRNVAEGTLDHPTARVRCTQANSTARLMGETLRAEKFKQSKRPIK